jgi:hypothetical protein
MKNISQKITQILEEKKRKKEQKQARENREKEWKEERDRLEQERKLMRQYQEKTRQAEEEKSVALCTYNRTYSLPARTVFLQHHTIPHL